MNKMKFLYSLFQTITQLAPEDEKSALKTAIEMINATVFIRESVGNLLFHGYRDALVDLIQFLTGIELLPNAMFGFFYGVCIIIP